MWFKKKKNRKRRRDSKLVELKIHAKGARKFGVRLMLKALLISLMVLGGGVAIWHAGKWALDEFVYENEAFSINEIEVVTNGVIPKKQLCRWAGVEKGDNLLALDLGRVRRNLELVPFINSVAVERVLPQKLVIRVGERIPVLKVHALYRQPETGDFGISVYYIDKDGFVMMPLEVGGGRRIAPFNRDNLPVLYGVGGGQLRPGSRIEMPRVYGAVRLLAMFRSSSMSEGDSIARIDVSEHGVIHVITAKGSEIVFGLENMERQLLRWRAVYEEGMKRGERIGMLDLSVGNNVPVTWAGSGRLSMNQ
ncbi:MAG: FtsQ-type POTRA domain-containing protein [Verrucomicrobia bacterium]|nr:FtsQ-type POTRA domain-containing protein [Verrucomicrobiota bacterium]MCF7708300.1 FtsQ-type POTRA domain-containing protein [Verrucomicrobiota bacterium]